MAGAEVSVARCAVHPARLAVDSCPVCARPRCAPDAAAHGGDGCAVCVAPHSPPAREPTSAELWVRAGLAGIVVAVAGGWVATQYVGVHVMSLIAPALVGLAASAATTAAVRQGAGARRIALVVAAGAAVLGTALGFRFTPGGESPLSPAGHVGPPYAAALAGVLAWPLLFGTPGRRRSDQDEAETAW